MEEKSLYRKATDQEDEIPVRNWVTPHYPAPSVIAQNEVEKEIQEIRENGVIIMAPRSDFSSPELEDYITGYIRRMAEVKVRTGELPEWRPRREGEEIPDWLKDE